MPDSRMMSVHLEPAPDRRDAFRAARDRVRHACGDCTLAGDLPVLLSNNRSHIEDTIEGPPGIGLTFWVRDGSKHYPLSIGVNSIGRMDDNQVVLRDDHVSRRHCAIIIHRDGRAELHDVASKNGTILNGRKIEAPTRLHHGDQITLCTRGLVFLTGDPQHDAPRRGE